MQGMKTSKFSSPIAQPKDAKRSSYFLGMEPLYQSKADKKNITKDRRKSCNIPCLSTEPLGMTRIEVSNTSRESIQSRIPAIDLSILTQRRRKTLVNEIRPRFVSKIPEKMHNSEEEPPIDENKDKNEIEIKSFEVKPTWPHLIRVTDSGSGYEKLPKLIQPPIDTLSIPTLAPVEKPPPSRVSAILHQ